MLNLPRFILYAFGTKASITTTRNAGIVIGALAFEKNVFDGHTVPEVLAQVKRLINRVPKVGIADRGYRGKSKVNDTQIVTPQSLLGRIPQEKPWH